MQKILEKLVRRSEGIHTNDWRDRVGQELVFRSQVLFGFVRCESEGIWRCHEGRPIANCEELIRDATDTANIAGVFG